MKTFIHYFFYGNIWISLGAVCYLQTALWLSNIQTNWAVYSTVFLATYCTYQLSFFSTKQATSAKFDLTTQTLAIFKKLFWIASFLLAICLFFLTLHQFLFLSHLAFIAIFYTKNFFWINFPLRKIAYQKVFLVSYVWVAMAVIFPIISAQSTLNLNLFYLFLARLLSFVALVLPFDIRDSETDQQMQLATIYNKMGKTYYNLLIAILLLISLCLHYYVFPTYILLFIVIHILIFVLNIFAKPQNHELYFTGLIDGVMCLEFLGMAFENLTFVKF